MEDFHRFRNELNLSFDAAENINGFDNLIDAKGEPIALTPRHPKEVDDTNDKNKNKRSFQKAQP